MFALVDCNNFYASCERLFRPDLADRPIVVLSNNDGCVVARSAEAKGLGIKMAVPVYQIKEQIDRENIAVFSSNYALYGDISARVMSVLEQQAPAIEVYSIDEAFLDLSGLDTPFSLTEYGQQLKQRVYQHTGIHVSVGIAPTKTLAKLANYAAKQYPATQGVVDLTDSARQRRLLSLMPVQAVWGVGRRLTRRLAQQEIVSAQGLAECDSAWIRSHYSITLERTVRELNGQPCMVLEECPPPRQQILCSRSFARRITALADMRTAIAQYCARAAEKLRQQTSLARVVTVFIRTNPHASAEVFYSNSASRVLNVPSADSRQLNAVAQSLLQALWKPNCRYMKAGIMLSDLYSPGHFQPSLFEAATSPAATRLMHAIDQINQRGRGQVRFASEMLTSGWQMQRKHLSPAYTTRWDQLPIVKA
ncbi:translesion error-prone DNA polymerase V subunit UmuC [Amphritea sp. 1_MG-2023]|uniref:translesion error-prone DNA polymerase V subunit UmuC n=1 Tax=Amphritea sp. 1_MG-2023 TaxID=3062670 RepID=UPI0026E33EF8|nr:translesion error-prone DNA polymerase V subunit UmuC [Amphritea sp. 1_MG-2023]MDO6564652.1 translesion error-prone DNA polymerase V subunit UmuC [Amphritea sp. 1_MG-2023]